MRSSMKKFMLFPLFLILCASTCGKKEVIINEPKESPAAGFFGVLERDLTNTAAVITNNELIRNLTHLQRMDSGGNHYYPLEREALTKMIQSLSTHPYADCFLLNASGTVIYTMYDNRLLAKNAESFPKSLSAPHRHAKAGEPWIVDTGDFPEMEGGPKLLFSIPVKRGNEIEGALIAALNEADIAAALSLKGKAVDRLGIIRLSSDASELFTAIPDLNLENVTAAGIAETASGKVRLTPFAFRNLQWIIVTPE